MRATGTAEWELSGRWGGEAGTSGASHHHPAGNARLPVVPIDSTPDPAYSVRLEHVLFCVPSFYGKKGGRTKDEEHGIEDGGWKNKNENWNV